MNLSALVLCLLLVLSSFGMSSAAIPDKIKIDISDAKQSHDGYKSTRSMWAKDGRSLVTEHGIKSVESCIDNESYLHPLRGIGYDHDIDANGIVYSNCFPFPFDEMNLITFHYTDEYHENVVNAYYNNGSVRYLGYYIPDPRNGTAPAIHDEIDFNSGAHWVNP